MQDKERKAAAEKAKAAERKEHSQERRRKSGQGSLLPDLPNISDGEHAADDRPALRSGKRKHADPAREANNDSVWNSLIHPDFHKGLHSDLLCMPQDVAADCQMSVQKFSGM